MSDIVKIILVLVLAPIVGGLIAGADRKITAHLQHRVGPPLLQPFYDCIKLMNKNNLVTNKYQNWFIATYFISIVASLVMLVLQMDFLMILFVFTVANIALIIGAMATGSPYAKLGCQREIMAMLAYEPVLLFYIIGMYLLTGSFKISSLANTQKPLIMYLPLIFISMLFIMTVKFKKSPFDLSSSHHAHQELVKGIFTEFSGPSLMLIEIAHFYETIFLLGLMFMFWSQNPIIGLIIAVATYFFEIVLDNIEARLTWKWLFKFTWTFIIAISIVNIVWIYVNNLKIV